MSSMNAELNNPYNEQFSFRPPTPPKNTTEYYSNIGDGKFEYITNPYTREMFANAWQAITQTNLWDFVSGPIDSFMWSKQSHIDTISEKMEELGYSGHSGSSFGSTMRNMQYLAQNGENKFKELFNRTHISEEVESDRDIERFKHLIKRRVDTGYYEKKDKEDKKLIDYMGGY